jgi:hypothetical protein
VETVGGFGGGKAERDRVLRVDRHECCGNPAVTPFGTYTEILEDAATAATPRLSVKRPAPMAAYQPSRVRHTNSTAALTRPRTLSFAAGAATRNIHSAQALAGSIEDSPFGPSDHQRRSLTTMTGCRGERPMERSPHFTRSPSMVAAPQPYLAASAMHNAASNNTNGTASR